MTYNNNLDNNYKGLNSISAPKLTKYYSPEERDWESDHPECMQITLISVGHLNRQGIQKLAWQTAGESPSVREWSAPSPGENPHPVPSSWCQLRLQSVPASGMALIRQLTPTREMRGWKWIVDSAEGSRAGNRGKADGRELAALAAELELSPGKWLHSSLKWVAIIKPRSRVCALLLPN